jgi:hypothetical protein
MGSTTCSLADVLCMMFVLSVSGTDARRFANIVDLRIAVWPARIVGIYPLP